MVCKMVKKGVVGTAIAASALYLAFGTSAPSYVKTAFHKVRHNAQDSVPLPFEIDRARDLIDALEPAILENREILARAEVDCEYLVREIDTLRGNLDKEKKGMVALRDGIASGDLRLAKNSPVRYTADEVKGELGQKLDHYKNVQKILEEKETTLKARQKSVITARQKLTEMAAQKRQLATQLATIEAKLQAIEAAEDKNDYHFDDSALAQAKKTVADIERRLEVKTRVAEMQGNFVDGGLGVAVEPSRDVVKEFDDEFGKTDKADAPKSDKSL